MRNSVVKKMRKLVRNTKSNLPATSYEEIKHNPKVIMLGGSPYQYEPITKVLGNCQKKFVKQLKVAYASN